MSLSPQVQRFRTKMKNRFQLKRVRTTPSFAALTPWPSWAASHQTPLMFLSRRPFHWQTSPISCRSNKCCAAVCIKAGSSEKILRYLKRQVLWKNYCFLNIAYYLSEYTLITKWAKFNCLRTHLSLRLKTKISLLFCHCMLTWQCHTRNRSKAEMKS